MRQNNLIADHDPTVKDLAPHTQQSEFRSSFPMVLIFGHTDLTTTASGRKCLSKSGSEVRKLRRPKKKHHQTKRNVEFRLKYVLAKFRGDRNRDFKVKQPFIQVHPNASGRALSHPNGSEHVQMHPGKTEYVEKLSKMCKNLQKHTKTSANEVLK